MTVIRLTILGEPASKANSREFGLVRIPGTDKQRVHIRKSEKALAYEESAQRQIPPAARAMLEGPVRVTMTIYYRDQRSDLDESIILDVMQARFQVAHGKRHCIARGVYLNDRQVRERHVFHAIDKLNPRAEIVVEPLQAQQPEFVQTRVIREDEAAELFPAAPAQSTTKRRVRA